MLPVTTCGVARDAAGWPGASPYSVTASTLRYQALVSAPLVISGAGIIAQSHMGICDSRLRYKTRFHKHRIAMQRSSRGCSNSSSSGHSSSTRSMRIAFVLLHNLPRQSSHTSLRESACSVLSMFLLQMFQARQPQIKRSAATNAPQRDLQSSLQRQLVKWTPDCPPHRAILSVVARRHRLLALAVPEQ